MIEDSGQQNQLTPSICGGSGRLEYVIFLLSVQFLNYFFEGGGGWGE